MTPYYEHAGITIYHGDCREILPQLGRVDAAITDKISHGKSAGRQRKEEQRCGDYMGAAQGRDSLLVPRTGLFAGATGEALRDSSICHIQGSEEAWDNSQVEGATRGGERTIQEWKPEHAIPESDSEEIVQSLRQQGSTSSSPSGWKSPERCFDESGSALLALSQQSPQKGVLETPQFVIVTDPPYGIALSNHGMSSRDYSVIGDESLDSAAAVLEWAQSLPVIAFSSPWKPLPGIWRNLLVWDKGDSVGAGGDPTLCFKRTWELIQVKNNGPLLCGRNGSVLRFPVCSNDFVDHPCAKPVELLERLIGDLAPTSATILDPFMGSGTTLVAAKNLGRKAIGIEIEERYCEIAAKRLSQEVLSFPAQSVMPEQACLA